MTTTSAQQVDLFLDQLVDSAPIKDERALMEFPFFSLQKRPRTEPLVYDDGKVRIEVQPGKKGMATIWDKDLLIYLASVLNDRLERGLQAERKITFAAYDFLRVTGRGTGMRAYELFLDALFRLRSTTIVTTIEAAGQRERRGFGWIETWRVLERTTRSGEKVMAGVEVTLNDWMHRAIVKDRRVLTINREYFRLTQGLERRLYELARKHVGAQPEWYIGLERLYEKCGSLDTIRKFKMRLKAIAAANTLPDYRFEVLEPPHPASLPIAAKPGTVLVRFAPRAERKPPALTAPEARAVADPAPQSSAAGRRGPAASASARSLSEVVLNPDVYEEARRVAPGYDVHYLEKAWRSWVEDKGLVVTHPERMYLSFCSTASSKAPLR